MKINSIFLYNEQIYNFFNTTKTKLGLIEEINLYIYLKRSENGSN
jgi:hypothetical protein